MVVGPTGSGKTELALSLAEQRGGEIIGADSVQIYRRFDAGSGKPSAEERSRAPHHLVDCLDPLETVDAARWADLAATTIDEIRSRDRVPILCGGTFLWVRALLFGLAEAPPADPEIRARHAARAEAEGRAALHEDLQQVDPVSAEKLAPNDYVRVSRALEVFELAGKPLSTIQAEHGFREPKYRAELVGVAREREELDTRIERRVHGMLEAGWVAEVEQLFEDGYGDARAMKSVGYRIIADAVRSGEVPEDLEERIVRATRVFARRQRTWLRDEPVNWTAPQNPDA